MKASYIEGTNPTKIVEILRLITRKKIIGTIEVLISAGGNRSIKELTAWDKLLELTPYSLDYLLIESKFNECLHRSSNSLNQAFARNT